MREFTEENLRERVAYWQRALRLADWQIACAIVPAADLYGGGQAENRYRRNLRQSMISIRREEDWNEGPFFEVDWEQSVVHELLHLHTDAFRVELDTPEQTAEEQAIDALASALVRLERQDVSHVPGHKDPESDPQGCAEWWCGILGLSDWKVRASFVDREVMQGATGYCAIGFYQQSAKVFLSRPAYEPDAFPEENDAEVALVHELVHLHLHAIWDEEAEGLKHEMQERAVELIAQALVNHA